MDSFLWFIASLITLFFVVRWIHRHMHGIAYLLTRNREMAVLLYSLPLLPGVILHELSHVLMAFILRVRTQGFTVVPRRETDGRVALGSVMVERVDAVRASLIGLAPFLAGSIAIWWIGQSVFGLADLGATLLSGHGPTIGDAINQMIHQPDAWLWLYLLFAISNTMFPSASDRETWPPVILFIAGVFILLVLSARWDILEALASPFGAALTWLTAAFVLTLIVDVPVMVLIALAERGAESIRGQRVYYSTPGESRPPKRTRSRREWR
jgi:hypothetical protein